MKSKGQHPRHTSSRGGFRIVRNNSAATLDVEIDGNLHGVSIYDEARATRISRKSVGQKCDHDDERQMPVAAKGMCGKFGTHGGCYT